MGSHELKILGRMEERVECAKVLCVDNPKWTFDHAPAYSKTEFKSDEEHPWDAFCALSGRFPWLVFILRTERADGHAITILTKGGIAATMTLTTAVEMHGELQRNVDRCMREAERALYAAAGYMAGQIATDNRLASFNGGGL
jgi:hypothetical protein